MNVIFALAFCLNAHAFNEVDLGKELFFDQRLSLHNDFSCATCHDIHNSGENNLAFAVTPDGRHTQHAVPTVFNVSLLSSYFWIGSAQTLEQQAVGPLGEMTFGDLDVVSQNLNRIEGYRQQFKAVFRIPTIQLRDVVHAIASFERTLNTFDSPYDLNSLTLKAKRGQRFFREIGCAGCHDGPAFGGTCFTEFPIFRESAYVSKYKLQDDLGRFQVTQNPQDKNVWRVAPLRNIALTAPYFHNGSVDNLDEAVRIMASTQLNRKLSQLEVRSLVAFLNSLTGTPPRISMPELPR